MHMKYLQGLADMRHHYECIMQNMSNTNHGHLLLETWNINPCDKDELEEEQEALRYLIGCQTGLVHDTNAIKPSVQTINRCFERHLDFLHTIHDCHTFNHNKHRSKIIQEEYNACRHYIFKFSLPAWVEKIPDEILTFENKYPDFN